MHFKGMLFRFFHVTYIKDEYILVFRFIFDLLWTGWGSAVTPVTF